MTVRSACVSCVTAAAVFGLAAAASAQQLPNPLQTPGAKNRANQAQVCAADFAADAKPVAKWQREQALARYGRSPNDFEGDLDGYHRRPPATYDRWFDEAGLARIGPHLYAARPLLRHLAAFERS